jgi:NhaA family Na+:H+ antiporter
LLVALRIAEMPEGSDWKQIIGVSFLAGTGFTMSLFIAELAFQEDIQIAQAKTAVLVASIFAATIGIVILGSGKIKTAKRPS